MLTKEEMYFIAYEASCYQDVPVCIEYGPCSSNQLSLGDLAGLRAALTRKEVCSDE